MRKAAKEMGRKKAAGADGLMAHNWSWWPAVHRDKLAQLVRRCEGEGRWPEQAGQDRPAQHHQVGARGRRGGGRHDDWGRPKMRLAGARVQWQWILGKVDQLRLAADRWAALI